MVNKVNDTSDAVAAMQSDWRKIDALVGGTAAMRKAREVYLPKFPRESDDSYDYRVKTSTLFNGLGRTLENMSAKPFAEAVTHTGFDSDAETWLENIDLCGNNITVFAHNVLTAGLKYGLTHILIESPTTTDKDGKLLYPTRAAEAAAGVRPYLVHIEPAQVIGWRSAKGANGAEVAVMVRIMESVEEPAGDFGTRFIQQIRVLTPSAWETYRKNDKDEWLLHENGPMSLGSIPLVTFYTRRTGFMTAVPPLRDLADLNIKHWQSSSDQDSILHTARVPILALIGLDEGGDVSIGAKSALRLPQGGDAKYVEHTGAAIEAGRQSLQDLEAQMRAMGAELLVETQVSTTATQNNIEDDEAKCQLSRMVEGLEDALDNAVGIMHAWVKREYVGDIDIFDDFSSGAVLQAAGPFLLALANLVEAGMLSKEDAFGEMRRYGIINPDLAWEDVQARINADLPPTPAKLPVSATK
ncbi:DUF4055 domain-containing protein [Janthinobacterium sp. SUN137]|uniref:DUF4055 domain-containing protein n=1 Tax=Janthinobacterium sp. SUN137 TaxID=3014789 RepID=UPI0027139E44|nr:DUF4055 domain-containing protein [Janthinobacterium sp. SUN137]MDO8039497.1 DUF4055 domain-containing protein [Janthinobacterium sp. SUN137]